MGMWVTSWKGLGQGGVAWWVHRCQNKATPISGLLELSKSQPPGPVS